MEERIYFLLIFIAKQEAVCEREQCHFVSSAVINSDIAMAKKNRDTGAGLIIFAPFSHVGSAVTRFLTARARW